MKRFKAVLTELSVATAFSLALAGIVFSPAIFAQPHLAPIEGLRADGQIEIEILEVDERGFPTAVKAVSDGRRLSFQLTDATFSWIDEDHPENRGSGKLPSLDEVASWKIELEPDGGFRAAIPSRHFEQAAPERPAVRSLGPIAELDRLGLAAPPAVETLGVFDPAAKRFELSALLPGGELVDITVSLASLPAEARLGGGLAVGELTEKFWIFVAVSIVLRILAIIFITCLGLIASCGFICSYTCPAGVNTWNAQCGAGGGCDCDCSGPPPAPETPCGGGSGLVAQGDQLKVSGTGALDLPPEPFTLTRYEESGRVHHGRPVSFLMGEWALLSYTVGGSAPGIEVLRSSSREFAESRRPGLTAALSSPAKSLSPGRHTVLLVARPDHDANSREIPLPRVRLAELGVPLTVGDGRVLVRADVSEERRLQGFEVLHETVGGLSARAAAGLRQAIGLEYASERSHRVVVFALLDVSSGEVTLADAIVYLPKCCCGGEFCF